MGVVEGASRKGKGNGVMDELLGGVRPPRNIYEAVNIGHTSASIVFRKGDEGGVDVPA